MRPRDSFPNRRDVLATTLASAAFRAEIDALPGYDVSRTGTVVLDGSPAVAVP